MACTLRRCHVILTGLLVAQLAGCGAPRAAGNGAGATRPEPLVREAAGGSVPPAPAIPVLPRRTVPEGLRVQTTLLGTFDVHWRSEPATIERGKVFALRAWITPHGSREVVPWTTLGVDADMPEHLHGMNRVPRVSRQEDGSFLVEGMLFHMLGRWNLYFDVHEAAIVERAQLELELD